MRLLALLATLLCFSLPAKASLSTDAAAEGSGTVSLSFTYTPVADIVDGMLLFCFAPVGAADYFSGATYGGTAMTFVTSATDDSGEPGYAEVYFLGNNVPSGAQSAVCTLQNAPGNVHGVAIGLTSSTNLSTLQVGVACGFGGDAANPSCSISGITGNAFIATGMASGNDSVGDNVGAAPTTASAHTHDFGTTTTAVYTSAGETGTHQASWTAASNDVAMVALAVQEVPASNTGGFAFLNALGTAGCGTSVSSCALTTTAAVQAGNLAICTVSKDETGTGTTDGDNSQFTTMTDSAGGNTWTRAGEFCNMQDSSAATGQCVGIYHSRVTNEIANGGTITINYSASTSRGAITCQEFTSQRPVAYVACTNGAPAGSADDGADPTTMNCQGKRNIGWNLFYRAVGGESLVTTIAATSNFQACTTAASSSGAGATSSIAACEWSIWDYWRPGGTGGSINSNPTIPTTADFGSLYLIFTDQVRLGFPVTVH